MDVQLNEVRGWFSESVASAQMEESKSLWKNEQICCLAQTGLRLNLHRLKSCHFKSILLCVYIYVCVWKTKQTNAKLPNLEYFKQKKQSA